MRRGLRAPSARRDLDEIADRPPSPGYPPSGGGPTSVRYPSVLGYAITAICRTHPRVTQGGRTDSGTHVATHRRAFVASLQLQGGRRRHSMWVQLLDGHDFAARCCLVKHRIYSAEPEVSTVSASELELKLGEAPQDPAGPCVISMYISERLVRRSSTSQSRNGPYHVPPW